MTAQAAIFDYLSSFGLTAYESTSVPSGDDAPSFPYLTYSAQIDYFTGETPLQVNLWYKTTNNATLNAKANEIGEEIGRGGVIIQCDDGAIWIKRGTPFCQSMSDPNDDSVKRRYINLTTEFLTM